MARNRGSRPAWGWAVSISSSHSATICSRKESIAESRR